MAPKQTLKINLQHICQINTLLQDLNLPHEKHSLFTKEETLFLRLYDIQRFGYSTNKQIHKLWIQKESIRNLTETDISYGIK
uniref:Uncharacterized protein n=1 Tax=viral metagenome TaxID=1070528 RepID=A0A6C0CUH0_9ZZZZ